MARRTGATSSQPVSRASEERTSSTTRVASVARKTTVPLTWKGETSVACAAANAAISWSRVGLRR